MEMLFKVMEVLMFLEPVGCCEELSFLSSRFFWFETIYAVVHHAGGVMALATNSVLYERWQGRGVSGERPCFIIDSNDVLSDFEGDWHKCAKALYEGWKVNIKD